MNRLRRALRSRPGEDGFTMVELMAAMGVMLVALVAMLWTTLAGFRGVATARRRQTANALANQTVEQVRALPFDTVKKGLSDSDSTVATDSAITSWTYKGESMPHATNPPTTPLNPHRQSVTRGNLTYTVSTYVTYYQNQTTSNTYRVTIVVSWPALQGGSGSVQVQTVVFSPSGSESCGPATHPFAAPCQAFLYGSTSNAPGQINVTGTIAGFSLDHAALWLPGQTSGMQIEQVQAVQGTAQTSGVTLQQTGQAEQSGGRAQATSGADNDPSQPKPAYQTASIPSQAVADLSASGSGNTIAVHDDAGDTAATTSTVSASTPNPCPVTPPVAPSGFPDVFQNDSQPCGSSKSLQGGSLTTNLTLQTGTSTFTTTPLATVATPSASSASGGALTNRVTINEGTVCPQVSGDGCVQSKQYRSRGTVTLAQLPSNLNPGDYPTGYDSTKGLVQLTGFSDSVSAEAGKGAGAPSVSVTGTIQYYNGTSTYGTVTLAPGASQAIPLGGSGNPGVLISDGNFHGAPLQISVAASLATGGTSTADAGASSCGATCRSSASAQSNSPITGTVTYQVTYNGTVIADVTMSVDLGTLLAKSSYTAAVTGA